MSVSYIAVHGGAGFHGMRYEKEIKRALRRYDGPWHRSGINSEWTWNLYQYIRACVAGLSAATNSRLFSDVSDQLSSTAGSSSPSSPASSLSMVESAICVLEDEEHLNAGRRRHSSTAPVVSEHSFIYPNPALTRLFNHNDHYGMQGMVPTLQLTARSSVTRRSCALKQVYLEASGRFPVGNPCKRFSRIYLLFFTRHQKSYSFGKVHSRPFTRTQ